MATLNELQIDVHVVRCLSALLGPLLLRGPIIKTLGGQALSQELLQSVVSAELIKATMSLRNKTTSKCAQTHLCHSTVEKNLSWNAVGLVNAVLQMAHQQHIASLVKSVVESMIIDVGKHRSGFDGVVTIPIYLHCNVINEFLAVLAAVSFLGGDCSSFSHQRIVLVIQVFKSTDGDASGNLRLLRRLIIVLNQLSKFQERSNVKQTLQEIRRMIIQKAKAQIKLIIKPFHKGNQIRSHLNLFFDIIKFCVHLLGFSHGRLPGRLLSKFRILLQY
mmetsp:Transcript_27003/g.56083  ORF Transcript_27003/g.56083 Transcript_27003/m.56083 type:complete len:275 (+) Transcript_27003:1037-1861(+)